MSALVSVALFWLTLQNALSCVNYKREPFIKTPHVAALILARGGSKGITLKNLQTVGNETLLGRALTTINQIKFSSIWVSTDHFSIALEADKYGANIHWRSAETATDQASSISAAQEFLVHHSIVDGVALIQCTSPFNKKEYLQRGFDLFGFHECVFSVTR
ncbi:N-acylneuraminate cytidylyltransferase [Cylas formicarius]|uniref:N-acylneuraminate cytidylyltransferase n=1 Tax=Cylas formicarius TaxID=197179 RepID=UPI0029584813|nr:N-acylneuraminate cytidylyltransferase [Cylas formicarius]